MLTCVRVVELLSDFNDAALGEEMHVAIQQHLDGCGSCRTVRETYVSTQHLCRAILQTSCPAELGERLLEFLKRETRKG